MYATHCLLLADAYGGYNGVVAGNQMTRAGCWSHARRKIVDAEKVAPEMAREAVEQNVTSSEHSEIVSGNAI